MKKTFVFSICFLFFANFLLFSAGNALAAANRRTSVRCLKLAESYLSSGEKESALSQAELGLAYDDSVSDLWYIKAASKFALGASRAEVLPLVTHSLTEGEWVDYNRDGARVLYADLLSDTGKYEEAIGILDAEPFIYSSDAEYIRVKSYYRIRSVDSVNKARDKVNAARKIYPNDVRFPKTFFKYEYDFHRPLTLLRDKLDFSEESEVLVQKIADSFLAKMPEYDNPDAELEIYSIFFAEGEKQKRMAEAFVSHGMKHPLYALIALNCGLMTQQEAWDYFCSFADSSVSVEQLEDILPFITDEVTIASVKEHLDSFSGNLTIDTDFDCEPNVFAKYSRGRAESVSWDKENDGINEWSATCDFGVPETLLLTNGNIELYYGTYPSVVKAIFKSDKISENAATFNLVDETLDWTPLEIEPLSVAKELFNISFFVPYVSVQTKDLDEDLLLKSCSSYEIASEERKDAKISFSVLDGLPQTAEYSANGKTYAHAVFKNGFPTVRSVDNDGDGIFETVETFGYDPENKMHISTPEQEQVMTNLFGLPVQGSGIYLKMVQIDYNGDTLPDFTEEYLNDNGKITSWDFNGDSNWDLRYKRYPKENSSAPLIEDAQFYTTPERELVTVTLWNEIPVKVEYKGQFLPVTRGAFDSFYWIGEDGGVANEKFVMENFNQSEEQGKSVIFQNKDVRIMVVKIASNIYAEILPSYDDSVYNETKNDSEQN